MADADLSDAKAGCSTVSRPRIFAALVAALALAGCNAGQGVNPSAGPTNTSGPFTNHYNPYNPVTYGQTAGFYGGR
jgi:hypothetical protein